MNKIILFNPFAAKNGYRIPNSILHVAASVNHKYEVVFVDGNREDNPWSTIKKYLDTGEFKFFGCTVMPGPQLRQAIPYTKKIREEYPDVINIWGGYFASNQFKTAINSGYVDFIINGQGDNAFPQLLDKIEAGESNFEEIKNLIYQKEGEIVKTKKEFIGDQNGLPDLPYSLLNQHYSLKRSAQGVLSGS
ncbi:MAG: radical SAM protein, partial [Bacteroidota bacterium]